ncbi:molybdenum cofactor guanylyltransferase [Candidatus Thorarchaeota archaeon]|nr:MAG: molybdenum cofactor guanylyltransferase [Candidatus Thorarchaeota archaeon]
MKDVGVAILAGGASKRFGSQKALAVFRGKPLIAHMIRIARSLSDSVIIVVSSESQLENIEAHVEDVPIHVDPPDSVSCALTGTLTAFEYASRRYTQLLPVDAPLVNPDVMRLLEGLAPGHGAVVPSWPNGYLEPLHSIYDSEHAYALGLEVMEEGLHRMSDLLDRLSNVLYVSTEALKNLDPGLETFTNLNNMQDLLKKEK